MPPPLEAAAAFGVGYRPMTEADMPFVYALYASTRAEEVAATGWPPEAQEAFLNHQHQAQHRHYFEIYPHGEWLIVERAGEAIGRLYLADQGDELHLIDISLVEAERGQGLGGAILGDLLADAAARGKAIELYVEKFNPARRLYLRLGFAPFDENGIYERMLWRAP